MTHSRGLAAAVAVVEAKVLEPTFLTAAGDAGRRRALPGLPDSVPELMERAGKAVADLVVQDFAECTASPWSAGRQQRR